MPLKTKALRQRSNPRKKSDGDSQASVTLLESPIQSDDANEEPNISQDSINTVAGSQYDLPKLTNPMEKIPIPKNMIPSHNFNLGVKGPVVFSPKVGHYYYLEVTLQANSEDDSNVHNHEEAPNDDNKFLFLCRVIHTGGHQDNPKNWCRVLYCEYGQQYEDDSNVHHADLDSNEDVLYEASQWSPYSQVVESPQNPEPERIQDHSDQPNLLLPTAEICQKVVKAATHIIKDQPGRNVNDDDKKIEWITKTITKILEHPQPQNIWQNRLEPDEMILVLQEYLATTKAELKEGNNLQLQQNIKASIVTSLQKELRPLLNKDDANLTQNIVDGEPNSGTPNVDQNKRAGNPNQEGTNEGIPNADLNMEIGDSNQEALQNEVIPNENRTPTNGNSNQEAQQQLLSKMDVMQQQINLIMQKILEAEASEKEDQQNEEAHQSEESNSNTTLKPKVGIAYVSGQNNTCLLNAIACATSPNAQNWPTNENGKPMVQNAKEEATAIRNTIFNNYKPIHDEYVTATLCAARETYGPKITDQQTIDAYNAGVAKFEEQLGDQIQLLHDRISRQKLTEKEITYNLLGVTEAASQGFRTGHENIILATQAFLENPNRTDSEGKFGRYFVETKLEVDDQETKTYSFLMWYQAHYSIFYAEINGAFKTQFTLEEANIVAPLFKEHVQQHGTVPTNTKKASKPKPTTNLPAANTDTEVEDITEQRQNSQDSTGAKRRDHGGRRMGWQKVHYRRARPAKTPNTAKSTQKNNITSVSFEDNENPGTHNKPVFDLDYTIFIQTEKNASNICKLIKQHDPESYDLIANAYKNKAEPNTGKAGVVLQTTATNSHKLRNRLQYLKRAQFNAKKFLRTTPIKYH